MELSGSAAQPEHPFVAFQGRPQPGSVDPQHAGGGGGNSGPVGAVGAQPASMGAPVGPQPAAYAEGWPAAAPAVVATPAGPGWNSPFPGGIAAQPALGDANWPQFQPHPLQGAVASSGTTNPERPADLASHWEAEFRAELTHALHDQLTFYSPSSLGGLLVGLGAGAALANTDADYEFNNWYQGHVRTNGSNGVARFGEYMGNGWYVIPTIGAAALAGKVFEDAPSLGPVGEFGDRATRAYLVGGGPLLLMQYTLGANRPSDPNNSSAWDPFNNSHGASGNAWVGAVPLITAAKMTDNPWAKAGLYFCSTLPGWARVNDNQHYLSQAVLGWWLAYLSCQAVDVSEQKNPHFSVAPMATPDMTGVGVVYQR
ncbi:MAG: hypothetical protein ABR915_06545 [Thermoguttaceae bacterium]